MIMIIIQLDEYEDDDLTLTSISIKCVGRTYKASANEPERNNELTIFSVSVQRRKKRRNQ